MRRIALGLALGVAVVLTGCSERKQIVQLMEQQDALTARIARMEKALDAMKQSNTELVAQLAEAKKAAVEKPVESAAAQVEVAVEGELDNTLASIIDARIDARIGTDQDIQNVFEQAVVQEFEARDEHERQEREERRERERVESEKRRAEYRERQINELAEAISLDDNQKVQVAAAYQALHESMQETGRQMREDRENFSWDQMRQAMTDLRTQYTESLKGVMTEEQFTGYQERREQQGRGRRGGHGGFGSAFGM